MKKLSLRTGMEFLRNTMRRRSARTLTAQHSSARRPLVTGPEPLEPRHVLAGDLMISEFMAKNDGGLRDGDGRSSDWIELFNASDRTIDLAEYRLSVERADPSPWTIANGSLAAGEYLILFASGKNYVDASNYIHTDFTLRGGGGYLALIHPAGQVLSEFGARGQDYPFQKPNVSYGFAQNVPLPEVPETGYIARPTPGTVNPGNDGVFSGYVEDTRFSVDRGFYDQPISVQIQTATPNAVIRYTVDGSAPTAEHGSVYSGPIAVARTTTLRAAAFRTDLLPTNVDTHTYIYLDDVLTQDGAGLPTTWGTFPFGSTEARLGDPVPANYEMDPEVVNDPRYRDTIRDDLKALPILSLVMDPDDLWGAERGIYVHTMEIGIEWERPGSVELFQPDGTTEFRVDSGVRLHGGFGRRPEGTAKHSFRLVFKGEYGPTKLQYPWFGEDEVSEFDTIVLRANYNYSWARGNRGGEQTGRDYAVVTDAWASAAQREMGGLPTNNTFVHLYVNGLYWGVYNPSERPDASFQAHHQGGREEDFDVMSHEGLVDGDRAAWDQLLQITNRQPLDYAAVQRLLDVPNFIDYMILNQFGGNKDWPQNNWFASRRRADGEKWQFHSWDAEFFFIRLNDDRILDIPVEGPGRLFRALRRDAQFRLDFADRIQRHLFNGGILTPEANIDRLNRLAVPLDRAVVGESARWGDAWMNQVSPPRTRDDDWIPRLEVLRNEYFPQRNDVVLNQYKRLQIYPNTAAPVMNQHGGNVPSTFRLTLANPNGDGTVYVTLDGTDPRAADGSASPLAIAFEAPLSLRTPSVVKARVLRGGEWSALTEATFYPEGDVDRDGILSAADIDALCAAVLSGSEDSRFDLTGDSQVDTSDHQRLVDGVLQVVVGDANLDGMFNSSDLVLIFQLGEYEDRSAGNSGWSDGDWNCDGEFSTSDLVVAFQRGGYLAT
jgi:hypothetical protein